MPLEPESADPGLILSDAGILALDQLAYKTVYLRIPVLDFHRTLGSPSTELRGESK